ncbi:nicotinate-nucleotide pyrophosphorylase [carboxylating] [Algoriphagus ratkowskyi]|uniref:Probable nicotinate-nucleotide pyrophosphorylase [carboxylating] n=1 Tax=Algoriphagus ratkowskyi TaxID=57028 RepID=A0A2W7RXJ6_9BACT|nr:carboxylating nicotinate-nucleotide diphosphorylase [Algoriphagus ratkowskyi]PZX59927.1 nicotinate-nucleotide pyrophosphorylase [carboxylating] [Algoriphagus ratkowskyi]TXD78371.1 carboxylating nicotinate-nucleotide diphosphorylase [Algoriphagus ratkowskyi]
MKPSYLTDQAISTFIAAAFAEDIGPGDYSSLSSIPKGKVGQAKLLIKDDGIIAGIELAEKIFKTFDSTLEVELLVKDGDRVNYGDIGLIVKGSSASILSSERLVLNCMQRMSGIATLTNRLTEKILHTKARLMDTRKTTPNFRLMEKWAVLIGGGVNHRFALYDMVMLKDNHVDFAGGIRKAIEGSRAYLSENKLDLKIEIETRNLDEIKQVLEVGGVDQIMLDNMDYDTMREAVRKIGDEYKTEASGGITEDTLVAVAECGVDYISMGALTHSVKSLDISLKAF